MAIKIIIDPGHYSKVNQSPVCKSYYEGNAMWYLAQYLMDELEAYGFEVGCTKPSIDERPRTVTHPLDYVYGRGLLAEGYDIMLSLHSNACQTESVDRAVLIVPLSGAALPLAEKLGNTVKTTMGVSSYQICQRAYDGTYFYDKSARTGQDYYGVIRGAASVNVPCIIIEHGFHTNTRVANWLNANNGVNLMALAKAEAKTIAEYYGVAKQEEKTEVKTETAEKEVWRVQVGAFYSKDSAQELNERLKAAGFTGFVVKKS